MEGSPVGSATPSAAKKPTTSCRSSVSVCFAEILEHVCGAVCIYVPVFDKDLFLLALIIFIKVQ